MTLRARYVEAARNGDLTYLQTAPKPTRTQLNRALRIACETKDHDVVRFILSQGPNDYLGAILTCCRVDAIHILGDVFQHFIIQTAGTLHSNYIYEAFSTACSHHSMETAFLMASSGRIEWTHKKLSGLDDMGLQTAMRVFKRYWYMNVQVIADEWWAGHYLQILQPPEYYDYFQLFIHSTFPIMAQTVISHRLDRYYRFKGYLIFHLPIPDLVTLCCGYF